MLQPIVDTRFLLTNLNLRLVCHVIFMVSNIRIVVHGGYRKFSIINVMEFIVSETSCHKFVSPVAAKEAKNGLYYGAKF